MTYKRSLYVHLPSPPRSQPTKLRTLHRPQDSGGQGNLLPQLQGRMEGGAPPRTCSIQKSPVCGLTVRIFPIVPPSPANCGNESGSVPEYKQPQPDSLPNGAPSE